MGNRWEIRWLAGGGLGKVAQATPVVSVLQFRVLGPLEVVDEDGARALGGAKQRAVLAVLLLHRGEAVSSERLIDEVWGDRPPATAAKTLQGYVSHLRKALGGDLAPDTGQRVRAGRRGRGVRLRPLRGARRRRPRRAGGREPGAARPTQLARGARALARAGARGLRATSRSRRRRSRGWRSCGSPRSRTGSTPTSRLAATLELVGELEALAREHPLRERLRAQLMLALYRSGRQADALEAYQDARRALSTSWASSPAARCASCTRRSCGRTRRSTSPRRGAAPAAGEVSGQSPFVGREPELGELLRSLEDACAGRGGWCWSVASPGSARAGCSTSSRRRRRERGARVLVGRCWEAGAPPRTGLGCSRFDPLLRDEDPGRSGRSWVPAPLRSRRSCPSCASSCRTCLRHPAIESEGARFRLFDATASFIKNAARADPLVLVLDDLHAADTPSLLLLRFVAGELAQGRILIVCAYRDVELRPTDPLASTLLELQRERITSRLRLGGLAEDEVARLIELFGGLEPSEALTAAIYSRTEGNPLFVDEVVRLLTAEGRLHEVGDTSAWSPAIPQSARDVIGRRLARLSPDVQRAARHRGRARQGVQPRRARASRGDVSRPRARRPARCARRGGARDQPRRSRALALLSRAGP